MGSQKRVRLKTNGKRRNERNGKRTVFEGKPTVLTDDIREQIAGHLRNGIPIEDACALSCVAEQIHFVWMKKGREYIGDIQVERLPNDYYERYAEYYIVCRKALSEFRKKVIERSLLPDAFKPTWIRDMTILERRDRVNWGKNNEVLLRKDDYDPDESFL